MPWTNRQRACFAAHIIFGSLVTLFIAARFTAKRMKRLGWTSDDYLLLVALLFVYTMMANSIASLAVGSIGVHVSSATPRQLSMTLVVGAVIFTLPDCAYSWQQFLWANQFQHTIALSLTRCSISLLFMRLFYTHMFPKLRAVGTLPGTPKLSSILHMPMLIVRLAWVCIAASLACLLIMMIVLLLRCRPVHYNWSKPLENAEYCYPLKPTIISLAGFGLIIDGVTWIMPHFVVWTLQLRRAHKIAITSIFALGILNIVIGISRITALADLSFTSDITYDVVSTMIWDMAQVSTAMILACCPLLRPVFERLIPKGLTRMATKITAHRKSSSIRVTTRIDVRPASIKPRLQSGFHDGFQETEGPTFEVERSFVVC